jgi:putative (di)nucleoside polyphosphate hydrolase
LYKGQKQIWFLLKFLGNENDIYLKNSPKPEFDNWSWVDYWMPNKEVIDFKKDVYSKALIQLESFINPN